MNKIKSAIITLILITAFFIVSTSVSASTINISPGQSIQTSINNANAGDTIILASGTYNEYGITINKNITIQGSSSGPSIIDGSGSGRVINVSSGVVATISSVTITNGKTPDALPGAGVNNQGTLTISNSTISNNRTGNGTVSGSAGNPGGNGGGVYNGGTLTISNSTISNNVTGNGGGPCTGGGHGGNGGGIYNSGTLTISNSTISNNVTGNGGCGNGGNGGGIYSNGTSNVKSSIIANNSLGTGGIPQGPDFFGILTSYGYNLIENTSGYTINGDNSGNITGVDPKLGLLAYNGGPTMTHALLSGSPAINKGSCTDIGGNIVRTDQRGYNRKAGSCDIGAYEYYQSFSLPIAKILEIIKGNQ